MDIVTTIPSHRPSHQPPTKEYGDGDEGNDDCAHERTFPALRVALLAARFSLLEPGRPQEPALRRPSFLVELRIMSLQNIDSGEEYTRWLEFCQEGSTGPKAEAISSSWVSTSWIPSNPKPCHFISPRYPRGLHTNRIPHSKKSRRSCV